MRFVKGLHASTSNRSDLPVDLHGRSTWQIMDRLLHGLDRACVNENQVRSTNSAQHLETTHDQTPAATSFADRREKSSS